MMKYLVLIALAITLSTSLSANSEKQILLAQQIAHSQTAQLKNSLGLSDKQAMLTYGVILKAATEINNYKNHNDKDLKTKIMEVQANSTEKLRSFLSKEQMLLYIELMTEANSKNGSIFYNI